MRITCFYSGLAAVELEVFHSTLVTLQKTRIIVTCSLREFVAANNQLDEKRAVHFITCNFSEEYNRFAYSFEEMDYFQEFSFHTLLSKGSKFSSDEIGYTSQP